jgi:ketosteroid isomerase-like protein
MKKILLSLVIVAALVACNNSTAVKTTAADEAYTKNLATAQAFFAAFAAKDSVKMASYVTDNFMWSPPAVGQDSLSKDAWYAQMQVFMTTFNDITFTNPLWRKGVDMDNNLDGSVRVYGIWNSKFASSGKTGLLKYYCTFDFDKDGKIAWQGEFYNAADLAIER